VVQKPWNYCNILRDDLTASLAQAGGLSYLLARGQSASPAQAGAQASGDYPSAWLRTACLCGPACAYTLASTQTGL